MRRAVLLIALVFLLGWFTKEFSDPDAWWHLKTGEYLWQQQKLPLPDPFAYTTYLGPPAYPGEEMARRFNLVHEWLAQILFYLAYLAAGFPGVVLLRALLLVIFCAITGLLAWDRSRDLYRATAAALACGVIASRFVSDRPFVITFVLLAATMWILERRRWLWALPPLFVFWANCHGGYFLGWFVLAAYCAEAWLRKGDRRLLAPCAVAVLASGLNPNFFQAIPVIFAYRQSTMQTSLLEWQHTALWPLEPFGVLLFTAIVVVIAARRQVRLVDWILFGAFSAAAIWAVRNVVLVGLIGPVLIAAYLPRKRYPEWTVAAFLVAAMVFTTKPAEMFRLQAAEWRYPRGAADFVLEHHLDGPIFNTYETGGYLIWRFAPQKKVFVDGRAINQTAALDSRRIAYNADGTGGKSREELLDQYGVQTIVMPGFDFQNGSIYLLAAGLADPSQTKWKLVYQDAQGLVFVRQPPPGMPVLHSLAALSSLEAQCGAFVEHDPTHPQCARALGELFTTIGDTARARQWLAFYLERKTEPDPEADQMYQRLLGRP